MTEEGRRLLAAAGVPPVGDWASGGDEVYGGRRDTYALVCKMAGDEETFDANADLIVAAVNQYEALLDLWDAAIGTVARIDAAADQGYDVSPDPALADLLREPLARLQASRDSTPDPLE